MKIALDLTSTPKNKTGIGRYLYNLVYALQQVDTKNEYYLFIQDDDVDGFDLREKNYHIVPANSKILRRPYLRILWEQVVFPFRLKRLGIDLLHSTYFTMPYLCPVKKIVTFHDMTYFIFPEVHTALKREMFKAYIRLSARAADGILSISNHTAKDILAYSKPKNRDIFISPLGVDWRFYEDNTVNADVLSQYGIESEYFLYVGTIEPRKNILRLLKAYNALDKAVREKYKLIIAGKKGWLYKEIFEYMRENDLDKYVHFTGYVKDEDLPVLYKAAKLFLYVSIYEGFGIPVVESMACGVPTITSKSSSMEEIAGDAALLVNPFNENEIRDAILNLLSDSELCSELTSKGYERAKEYNWLKCAQKTAEAYEKVMKL
jgi:Glycosyltransferase